MQSLYRRGGACPRPASRPLMRRETYTCYRLRIVFIVCYNSTTYLKEAI